MCAMPRTNTPLIRAAMAAVCSLGLLGAVGGTAHAGPRPAVRASPPIYLDTSYSFPERAADLVSRMSLDEKIQQLHEQPQAGRDASDGGPSRLEVEVLADVLVARPAGRAGVVPAQRHHGDRVTGPPALHAGADAQDPAGHLVPEDSRGGDPGVHVAVEDVQIGAADTGVGGCQFHLSGAGGCVVGPVSRVRAAV